MALQNFLRRRPKRGRGFSLIEGLIVLGMISLLTGVVVYWYSARSTPAGDMAARTALVVSFEAQVTAALAGAGALDAEAYPSFESRFLYTDEDSDAYNVVSVHVDDNVVYLAVLSDTASCWMGRLDLKPIDDSPRVLWGVNDFPNDEQPCSGLFAYDVLVPGETGNRGLRIEEPYVI